MSSEQEDQWFKIQSSIDRCSTCLDETLFKKCDSPPTRPSRPEATNCILFLSEAPPLTGGFWQLDQADNLRASLLPLLQIRPGSDLNTTKEFLERGYFLVQSLKWPLVRTFNHIAVRQQRTLIEHSAMTHLGPEIDLLKPKAILAMGKAAWLSCRFLSGQWNDEPGDQFEHDLGNMHLMSVKGKETKWMATYLIIGQNLRLQDRAKAISSHLKEFLHDVA